ncbi:MAG: LysR family transcriptional regulator [Ectothiorhodospiraceae bacterium]|nr:LysR family transcriptional regulator [Chromatiales bacterium]MCP5156398.1 LysR family transcriptional regulator [Ectothiorhodospiraceae bacterium]
MEIRQLSHLLAVIEHGSFSKAAAALGIGQPGLTKSVRRLEQRLGVPLLERRARGIEPTEYGLIVARHAKLIDVERREAISEVEAHLGGHVGRVIVGAGPAWLARVLPEAIARVHLDRPRLRFSVVTGYPEDLARGLRDGDLDLVVASVTDAPLDGDLTSMPLAADEQVVIVRQGHPLLDREKVGAEDLLGFPWVMAPTRTRVRQRLDSSFLQLGLAPPMPVIESDSVLFALSLLRGSNFLGMATRGALQRPEGVGLVALECPEVSFVRRTGVMYRRRGTLPSAALALVDALSVVCRDEDRV